MSYILPTGQSLYGGLYVVTLVGGRVGLHLGTQLSRLFTGHGIPLKIVGRSLKKINATLRMYFLPYLVTMQANVILACVPVLPASGSMG